MRPGLHLSNGCPITPADEDIVRRWTPLSALLAMNNIVEDNAEIEKLVRLWDIAGQPLLVLRKYFGPEFGPKPNRWGVHAIECIAMARRCIERGIPANKIALKPFNEPNMPTWAQWEGFGDQPEEIERYNLALRKFIEVAKNEEPDVLIGGPHLTVGNRDVRFPNDPEGRYYYGPASLCQEALDMLDLHFVHLYGLRRGQYKDPAHGLRFLEYEKYFSGKDIYIVEGAYGIKWENGNSIDPAHNNVRGEDTVAYLRLLDQYPQVKGITLWIGGDRGWQEYRHSDGWDGSTHRPVVRFVEEYVKNELPPGPEPPDPPDPPEPPSPPTDVEYVGLSDEMIDGLTIKPPTNALEAYWKIVRVEVQPETDHQSAFAVADYASGADRVLFWWTGGEKSESFKADDYAPPGAKDWAASMPMFAAWGGYSVMMTGTLFNSEILHGFGLYGADLNMDYTAHHPVLVYFAKVEPGTPPEPPEPPVPPEPPDPPPDIPYTLRHRLEMAPHGFEDLRSEIEAISNLVYLENRRRAFGEIEHIVLHNSGYGEPHTAMSTARQAIKEGEPTIEYHFCIGEGEQDGLLSWTAKLVYETNHTHDFNDIGIGVCILGDYSWKEPSEVQLETARFIIAALYEFLGQGWAEFRLVGLIPHRDAVGNSTICPGMAWPLLLWSGKWPKLAPPEGL